MGKAGGIIGLIAGIFGILGAAATLLFGGIGHAIGAEGAASVVDYGWGGVAFSFLVIVFSAMAIAHVRHAGVAIVIGSVFGMALGGWLVAICMFLALVGGVLAVIGQKKNQRALINDSQSKETADAPHSSKSWLLWVLVGISGLLAVVLLLGKPTTIATAPDSIAELVKAQTSALRPDGELADVFAMGGSSTNLQRENKLKEIRGQTVQWQLPVYEVSRANDGFKVQTQSDSKFGKLGANVIGAFVYVKPRNDEDRKTIEAMKTGDTISFKGRIADVSLRSLEIKPAILWRDSDRVSLSPVPEVAPTLPPMPTARTVSQVVLETFECGDVCHLTYRDASGSTISIVCSEAALCRKWASSPSSFALFVGTRADLVVGKKFIAEGGITVDSVTEIEIATPPPPSLPVESQPPTTVPAAPVASAVSAKASAIPSECAAGFQRVFVCLTQTARKRVEVCASPSMVSYSFGLVGQKADLAISVPKSSVSGYRWDGFGRYMNNSINVPNGATEYRAYRSVERDPNGTVAAGVHVVLNGKQVADVKCDMATEDSDLENTDVSKAKAW